MKLECNDNNGFALIKIEGEVSINDAELLQDEILIALADYKGVIFDLADIVEWDTSILQIFYATFLSAKNRNKKFSLLNPPQALIETLETIGFSKKEIFKYVEMDESSLT